MNVRLLSYCLMGNHYHLLLSVTDIPLSLFMHRLLSPYSHYFNRKHRRVGHLFQDRYTALPCEDLSYLLYLVGYIHKNPVRAGFTNSPAEWVWSSHEDFIQMSSLVVDFDRLQEVTGMNRVQLRDAYLKALASSGDKYPGESTLAQLVEKAAATEGLGPSALLSGQRGSAYSRAKRRLLRWTAEAGFGDSEVADYLGCSPAALSYLRRASKDVSPGVLYAAP